MKRLIALLLVACVAGFAHAADERGYTTGELEQMLAPVALYPDGVLSNILIASTYPVEVVQAARWSRDNGSPEGQEALDAVGEREWDPSVKALVAFPELLARMDDDIQWTQRVGEAFMFQETQVMDAIQGLRDRAYAAGNLRTTDQVRVVRETQHIVIEPAKREVVYVPYYDTRVVYGDWAYPSYPPVYWNRPARYRHASSVYWWGPPVYVTPAFYYSSFYWPQRHIVVVNVNHYRSPPQRWHYQPRHRPRGYEHRPRPRRDAQREWASQQRETWPRGMRGPGPMPTRNVTPAPTRSPETTRGPRGMRMPDATPTRQRDAYSAPSSPVRTQQPLVDTARPSNQFESRGRYQMPTAPSSGYTAPARNPSPAPASRGSIRGMPSPTVPARQAPTRPPAPAQAPPARPSAPVSAPPARTESRPARAPRGQPTEDGGSRRGERVR